MNLSKAPLSLLAGLVHNLAPVPWFARIIDPEQHIRLVSGMDGRKVIVKREIIHSRRNGPALPKSGLHMVRHRLIRRLLHTDRHSVATSTTSRWELDNGLSHLAAQIYIAAVALWPRVRTDGADSLSLVVLCAVEQFPV